MTQPTDPESVAATEAQEGPDGAPVVDGPISFTEFFERVPPGRRFMVADALSQYTGRAGEPILDKPELSLHCEICDGLRTFATKYNIEIKTLGIANRFVEYICKNCERCPKIYALEVIGDKRQIYMYKIGEHPAFGPPLPSNLITLLREEREYLRKGLRCENQGLGIGAFTYYRRVIELQKHRLFQEIIRVAEKTKSPPEMIADLKRAQQERQFVKAVREIQPAVPDTMLISGHNPLTRLHDALSDGVHELTDEECLSRATSIRVVLVAFAEQLATALKQEKAVSDALKTLLNLRTEKGRSGTAG